jgi:hypothetical protein
VLTTFTSYDEVPTERQAEIVRSLKPRKADAGKESNLVAELAAVVSRHLKRVNASRVTSAEG